MTVKELRDKLNYFPEHVEVFCDGYLIVGVREAHGTGDNIEYVELKQEWP